MTPSRGAWVGALTVGIPMVCAVVAWVIVFMGWPR